MFPLSFGVTKLGCYKPRIVYSYTSLPASSIKNKNKNKLI